MRTVTYAGGTVVTTDRVAATLVELTAALARRGLAEAVRIPIFDETSGSCHHADLVIGVGVHVLSVPASWDGDDAACEEELAALQRVFERSGVTAPTRPTAYYDRSLDELDLAPGERHADPPQPIPLRPRHRR